MPKIDRSLIDDNASTIFLKTALTISIVLGFMIRINGIGDVPLSVDEYFIVKSVQNVLKHGLPQFETGGYYSRGLLYQYILAIVSLLWGAKVEMSYRVITIFFNLLAIPAVFKLAKKSGGRAVGYIVSILFCFSLWEIEFSRFIRMYALFQTIFVWYLLFLYMVILENKLIYLKWAYLLSFISVFVYEGCIFLIVFNFLPFFLNRKTFNGKNFSISVLLLFFTYVFMTIDFPHLGVDNYYPTDVQIDTGSGIPLLFPVILLLTLDFKDVWFFMALIPIVVSAFVSFKYVKNPIWAKTTKISFVTIIVLSLLNLYGLLTIFFIIVVLLNWINIKELKLKEILPVMVIVLFNFCFWIIYIFFSQEWFTFFETTEINFIRDAAISQLRLETIQQLSSVFSWKKVVFVLFNFPLFYQKIISQWMDAIPVYTLSTAAIIFTYLTYFFLKKGNDNSGRFAGLNFLLALILLVGIGVAALNTTYNSTRYTFFIFPVILIIIVTSFYLLSTRIFKTQAIKIISFSFLTLIFVRFTEDYHFDHVINIGKKEYYLRMNYNKERAGHYYSRVDVKSPAEIVNKHAKEGDLIVTTVIHSEFYLEKLDYFYVNHESRRFAILSAEGGKKELWTNANLLYKEVDIFEVINKSPKDVWIIIYAPEQKDNLIEMKLDLYYKNSLYYRSYDRKINVYKIEKL